MDGRHTSYRYPRTAIRRVAYGVIGIAVVMTVGVVGFHEIEGMNLVNSIYFESMLATGQGPPFPLSTDAGKIFASAMAFVSVGSVITTLFFTLMPIFGQIWREVLEEGEEEARRIEQELKPKKDEKEKAGEA